MRCSEVDTPHTAVFSEMRLANRRPGSNPTTRLVVGQRIGPLLLMLSARVPAVVRPPRGMTLTAWLLHCGALRTSETISQTRAGGASISMELSMAPTGAESVVMVAFREGVRDGVSMVGDGFRRCGPFARREHGPHPLHSRGASARKAVGTRLP